MSNFKNNEHDKIHEKDIVGFVLERFDQVKKKNNINDLVKFHTFNKYLLMAHSQKYLNVLGNIVANHQKRAILELLYEYESNLSPALNSTPTIKSNLNVLFHIFGSFSKFFSNAEKDLYMHLLELYRKEKNTLGKTLAEVEPLIYRFNNTYLASQSYFLLYADIKKGNMFSYLSNLKF